MRWKLPFHSCCGGALRNGHWGGWPLDHTYLWLHYGQALWRMVWRMVQHQGEVGQTGPLLPCWHAFWLETATGSIPYGRVICQHCGEGWMLAWTVFRCVGCQRRRPITSQWLGRVRPETPYCLHCGEHALRQETLARPRWYQLHHAWLRLVPEAVTAAEQAETAPSGTATVP
jgi:hypothetical protein